MELFNDYVELSVKLNNANIGCNVNGTMTNHLLYVNDSALLEPSANGLQSLLHIYQQFVECKDIIYNYKKQNV